MTDYAVLRRRGGWSLQREGREIAAYSNLDEAMAVAHQLRSALLGGKSGTAKAPPRRAPREP